MEKTGKPPTGSRRLPPPSDQFENLPAPPPLASKPERRPILKARTPLAVAFRHIKPDWRRYITFVDLAARKSDTAMARVRDCYETLAPLDRVHYWPEQLCDLAQVSPGELVGAVCRQIWESKAAESSMVSSIAQPVLLLRTIELAKREDNFRDRELCYRMWGMLPDRKGNSININNYSSAEANANDPAGTRLKSFDEEVIDMTRTLDVPAAPPFLVKDDVPPEDH